MRWIKITGSIVVVGLAVYSGVWYYHANANQRQVETWISDLKASPFVETFEYESLSYSGFPANMKITMTKPNIVIDSDLLLNSVFAGAVPPKAQGYQGKIQIQTDGAFIITTNAAGSFYSLSTQGDIHSKHISETNPFHYRQEMKENHMRVDLDKATSWFSHPNLESLAQTDFSDFESFLKAFSQADIFVKDLAVYNDENDQLLYSVDEAHYGGIYEKGHKVKTSIFVDLNNIKITDAYAQQMANFIKDYDLHYNADAYKAYNNATIHMALKYDGPEIELFLNNPDGRASVDMDFSFENKLYQYANKGYVTLAFDNGNFIDLDVDLTGDALFEPDSHPFLIGLYQSVVKELETELAQSGEPQAETEQMFGFIESHLDDIIPKFHELGKIKAAFQLYAKNKGAMFFDVDLTDISLINDLYGVALNGKVSGSPFGQVDGALDVKMSDFDVMWSRGKRYIDLLIAFYEENNLSLPPHLNDELVPKLKTF